METKTAVLVLAFMVTFVPAYTSPVVIDQITTAEKVVALTIEDVDNSAQLDEVLTVLGKDNAKATFFIPARLAGGLPLGRAAALGHEFGNHSMNHAYWGNVNQAEIAKDLTAAASAIQRATGAWPRVIRPPYDWYGDSFFQAAAALLQPAVVIRGTETGDWLADTPDAMLGAASRATKPGAILNINMRFKAAAKALPLIVHQLNLDGYRIVTVSELMKKEKVPDPARPAASVEPPKKAVPPKTVKTQLAFAVFSRLPVSAPAVALTFDDGGSAWQVRKILEILHDTNIKATFFLLGDWAEANPDLVREMAAEGHEIANHSYSHPAFIWLNEEEIRNELDAAQKILSRLTKTPVRLFRPPYGAYNSAVIDVVRDMGFNALVLWDVDTRDWTGAAAGTIAYQVEAGVSSGSIVLFHLHGAHTAEALGEIIPNLKERGYFFTTVSAMLVN
jgi:peptidoglycan-N-acetylglucosamine deacetylase